MTNLCLPESSRARATVLLVLTFAALNTSCALRIFQPSPEAAVSEEVQLPRKVAILPFGNKTSNLRLNDLYANVTAGKNVSPQKLGQLLGVDAVIYGDVISLGKIFALVYSDNQAGLRARMVSCETGETIWEVAR